MAQCIKFDIKNTREQGRNTKGVRGIKFKDAKDYVVDADAIESEDQELLTVSELGVGKRTEVEAYRLTNRAGSGVISMKLFFSAPAIAKSEDKEEEISNSAIKSHLGNIVKNEDKNKPLSDEKLLKIIKKQYSVDIGRRTITKYRLLLNIGSSSERKKLYKMGGFVK